MARNPWRMRMRMATVVVAGIVSGVIVGWLLVEFLIKR